jgi:hypothetical protein
LFGHGIACVLKSASFLLHGRSVTFFGKKKVLFLPATATELTPAKISVSFGVPMCIGLPHSSGRIAAGQTGLQGWLRLMLKLK